MQDCRRQKSADFCRPTKIGRQNLSADFYRSSDIGFTQHHLSKFEQSAQNVQFEIHAFGMSSYSFRPTAEKKPKIKTKTKSKK